MSMPGQILDAYLARRPMIRARRLLDLAEAFRAAASDMDGFREWQKHYQKLANGGREMVIESVMDIRARKLAEREARALAAASEATA